jgi:hypothetical protein
MSSTCCRVIIRWTEYTRENLRRKVKSSKFPVQNCRQVPVGWARKRMKPTRTWIYGQKRNRRSWTADFRSNFVKRVVSRIQERNASALSPDQKRNRFEPTEAAARATESNGALHFKILIRIQPAWAVLRDCPHRCLAENRCARSPTRAARGTTACRDPGIAGRFVLPSSFRG